VRFLALLELCKMGRVTLGQGTTFGDLRIAWLAADAAGATSGRGLAELAGYEIDDYEG
jgi:chromatin segregation and condensation protein Rec8/ScpA/Scc1 (kleisin family)